MSTSQPLPQAVDAPLTPTAIFLVVTLKPGPATRTAVLTLLDRLPGLVRGVGARDSAGQVSCVTGIGAGAWDRLFDRPRPAGLHPFAGVAGAVHVAPSTPGDLLFHIRATGMDLCFELAKQIMGRLGDAVDTVDEVHGFRYFDNRSLIGFVDGTENPHDAAAVEATLIGAEDPEFAGGSYVITQKYLHDLAAWNTLSTEDQEKAIGRTKLDDIEFDEDVKPTNAHNALTFLVEDGVEVKILRDNMPFGTAGTGEFGTYFCGYARSPHAVEQMLVNMFVGRPPGNHDRMLDFVTAVTGALFFVPSVPLLEKLASD